MASPVPWVSSTFSQHLPENVQSGALLGRTRLRGTDPGLSLSAGSHQGLLGSIPLRIPPPLPRHEGWLPAEAPPVRARPLAAERRGVPFTRRPWELPAFKPRMAPGGQDKAFHWAPKCPPQQPPRQSIGHPPDTAGSGLGPAGLHVPSSWQLSCKALHNFSGCAPSHEAAVISRTHGPLASQRPGLGAAAPPAAPCGVSQDALLLPEHLLAPVKPHFRFGVGSQRLWLGNRTALRSPSHSAWGRLPMAISRPGQWAAYPPSLLTAREFLGTLEYFSHPCKARSYPCIGLEQTRSKPHTGSTLGFLLEMSCLAHFFLKKKNDGIRL